MTLTAPSDPQTENARDDALSISFSAEEDEQTEVERRERAYGTETWSDWQSVTTLAAGVEEFEDTNLDAITEYEYRLRHTDGVDGGERSDWTHLETRTTHELSDHWSLELLVSDDSVVIQEDYLGRPNLQFDHTAISRWWASKPLETGLEDWGFADSFLWYWDPDRAYPELVIRGRYEDPESSSGDDETLLEGRDIVAELEGYTGGSTVFYEQIEGYEALRDYGENHLPDGWELDIHEPTPQTVDTNRTVQEAASTTELGDLYGGSFDESTYPISIGGNVVERERTAFWADLEDEDTWADSSTATDDRELDSDATSGAAIRLHSSNHFVELADPEESPSTVAYPLGYTIPEDHVGIAVRWRHNGGTDVPVSVTLVDANTDEDIGTVETSAAPESQSWVWIHSTVEDDDLTEWDAGALDVDDLHIRVDAEIEVTNPGDPSDSSTVVDHVVLYDARIHDPADFDNTVHEADGQLDSPGLYGDRVRLETADASANWNITDADLNVGVNDAGGSLRMQLSFDAGETWFPSDGTEENTASISASNPSVSESVRHRVDLSGFGSRDTKTPRTEFQAQELDNVELSVDTNDLGVIENREFAGSHFSNLQELCRRARMRFWPEYAIDRTTLIVAERGAIVDDVDLSDIETEWTRSRPLEGYNNVLEGVGDLDEQGNRLEFEIRSESEIDRVGEEIVGYLEVNSDDPAEVKAEARSELSDRIARDSISGSLELPPMAIPAGPSVNAPQIDSEPMSIESVRFGDMASMTLDLELPVNDLAGELSAIRAESQRGSPTAIREASDDADVQMHDHSDDGQGGAELYPEIVEASDRMMPPRELSRDDLEPDSTGFILIEGDNRLLLRWD